MGNNAYNARHFLLQWNQAMGKFDPLNSHTGRYPQMWLCESFFALHLLTLHLLTLLEILQRRHHAHGVAAKNTTAGSNSAGSGESDRDQPSNHARKQCTYTWMYSGISISNLI